MFDDLFREAMDSRRYWRDRAKFDEKYELSDLGQKSRSYISQWTVIARMEAMRLKFYAVVMKTLLCGVLCAAAYFTCRILTP